MQIPQGGARWRYAISCAGNYRAYTGRRHRQSNNAGDGAQPTRGTRSRRRAPVLAENLTQDRKLASTPDRSLSIGAIFLISLAFQRTAEPLRGQTRFGPLSRRGSSAPPRRRTTPISPARSRCAPTTPVESSCAGGPIDIGTKDRETTCAMRGYDADMILRQWRRFSRPSGTCRISASRWFCVTPRFCTWTWPVEI
jgi:hypothetical protein